MAESGQIGLKNRFGNNQSIPAQPDLSISGSYREARAVVNGAPNSKAKPRGEKEHRLEVVWQSHRLI